MAAPIQRYSDPRLYGIILVTPFEQSYEWISTVAHPLHPRCSMITECTVRAMKVFTGILAIAMTTALALVGRIIQIIHYHSISENARLYPVQVSVDGMQLPRLRTCPLPPPAAYHGTHEDAAISILRWGFDPSRTSAGAKMAEAVYFSERATTSASYGDNQLIVSLDLREREVAYISNESLREFKNSTNKDFSNKTVMAAVRDLYYQNGYRAIKYDLGDYDTEEAWAIYDPSCISIQQIKPSSFGAQSRVTIDVGSSAPSNSGNNFAIAC